jgi:predicted nuclease of predicted toxin-antitoxin system
LKLLIDESLSARVAVLLVSAGHEAIHVGDLNMLGAPDTEVMAAASRDRRCVVSVDTDFGELLAVGKHTEPSVVLLRRAPHRPQEQAALLISALPLVDDDLDIGAIVVLTLDRARVRHLPI